MRHLGCSAFRFPRCGRGAKPRNGVRIHLTPARTRSEAEKQRQRWEKAVHPLAWFPGTELFSGQSLGAVSDAKLYLCAMLPQKRYRGMAHAHLKNPYMECRCHYSSESSCFTFLQLSAFNHLFWRSQEVRFSRIAKGGIWNLSRPNRGTSLKQLTRGEGFRANRHQLQEAFLALNLTPAFFHLKKHAS
jgi:hypothetical protein